MRRSLFLFISLTLLLVSAPRTRADGNAAAICPGDMLSITVYEHPELTTQVRVQGDGRIRLPLRGWFDAAGKTEGELSEALSKAYQEVDIERAFATVQITSYGPRTVYVIGEVLQGGMSIEITPPAKLTVTQAVSTAGGFTDGADLRQVAVRRTSNAGKIKEIIVDVLSVIAGVKGATDLELEVGDTVIIRRSQPVYVTGEVGAPGPQYVGASSSMMCSEVIAKAGGLTPAAERGRVLVFRRTAPDGSGSATTRGPSSMLEVDLDAVFSGDFAADLEILPGDNIVVPRRLKIYVFGEVGNPGALEVEPGVTLTAFQAVTLSGGFTDYAAKGNILLVRDGNMSEIDLRKPYRKGREVEDPPLKPGDILFVQESLF